MTTKTEAKHIPGPWVVNGDWVEHKEKLGSVETTTTIARCDYVGPIGIRQANQRLIAVAPELLNIAKAYRNNLQYSANTDGEVATFHHIEDVLARAKGGK